MAETLPPPLRTISKFLARHLRRCPQDIGLTLDPAGWADVNALLRCAAAHGMKISRAQLDEVVAEPSKRRYAYDATKTRIRAVQGHGVEVTLGYEPAVPPAQLFHDTHPGALDPIFKNGLSPMSRRQVHLSADRQTAATVGQRRR
jgi:putative RNA 2'-phosphotransferase